MKKLTEMNENSKPYGCHPGLTSSSRIFVALLLSSILSLKFTATFSQTTDGELSAIKAELGKITKAYAACKQLTLKATSTWYANTSSRTPLGSRSFSILIKGENIHYKADYMERISNEKYSVVLDHKDKTLILDKGAELKAGGDPRKFFKQVLFLPCREAGAVIRNSNHQAVIGRSLCADLDRNTVYVQKWIISFN